MLGSFQCAERDERIGRSTGSSKLLGSSLILCATLLASCSSDSNAPSVTIGGTSFGVGGAGGAATPNGGFATTGGGGASGSGGGPAGGSGGGPAAGGSAGGPAAGGSAGGPAAGGAGGSGGMMQACGTPQVLELSSTRHTAHPLGSSQAANGFYEYLPPGYGDKCPRPLLVFYPGSGELGNGNDELKKLLAHGPPKLIDQDLWPNDRPFVVLSVQHAQGCTSADNVDAFLAYALANYDIDPNRIYLTGLSCGAVRSWDYIGKYGGQRVAAIVPISGDGRTAWTNAGCDLGQSAIWAFHGEADMIAQPAGSIEPITHLMTCPMPPRKEVKLTTYPGVPHDSWTMTYGLSAGNDIYSWLLSKSK